MVLYAHWCPLHCTQGGILFKEIRHWETFIQTAKKLRLSWQFIKLLKLNTVNVTSISTVPTCSMFEQYLFWEIMFLFWR